MWAVETYTVFDGWVNCWSVSDEKGERPLTFEHPGEAFDEAMEHIEDMIKAGMDVSPTEFRLVKVS